MSSIALNWLGLPASAKWLPVASYSRTLEGSEAWKPPLMLELIAIQEGLRRMAHVATFA